jgi:hypothetical protein
VDTSQKSPVNALLAVGEWCSHCKMSVFIFSQELLLDKSLFFGLAALHRLSHRDAFVIDSHNCLRTMATDDREDSELDFV